MGREHGPVGMSLWFALLWISGYSHRLSAQVFKRNIYFSDHQKGSITLSAPSVTHGREFIWEWTSHKDNKNVTIAVIESSIGSLSWTHINKFFKKGKGFDISMGPLFGNAGVFSFSQTRPENVFIARFEAFALKVDPSLWPSFLPGADVSVRCRVSRLVDSATLQWEKEGRPTADTKLFYNNAAHVIIRSVAQRSQGRYSCLLKQNGLILHSVSKTLSVKNDTHHTSHNLYRDSSDSAEVLLVCVSQAWHSTASWVWTPFFEGKTQALASAGNEGGPNISTEIDRERFLWESYDRMQFSLSISPVVFQDAGRYSCYADNSYLSYITLITLQVSAVLPDGPSRNQSVVLNCEISQVIGSVTLAWLRMRGGRGELVKQEVLREGHPNRILNLTLLGLSEDQLHWACVVFTESMLRAQVPLHLMPLSAHAWPGWSTETVVRVVIVVLATLGMLKVLLWYCRRRPQTEDTSTGTQQPSEPETQESTQPVE